MNNMCDTITEIYNNLHRQATQKCIKDKAVVEARYEGYEQGLAAFARELDNLEDKEGKP